MGAEGAQCRRLPSPVFSPCCPDLLSSKTSSQNQAQLCRAPLQTKDRPSVGAISAARL